MQQENEKALVSTQVMELAIGVLLVVLSALVIYDSIRLGFGWGDEGPQSGYFPFYIGVMLCLSSVVTMVQALGHRESGTFVERGQAKLVLAVLIPCVVFVVAVSLIGIYVASAVFIAAFMAWQGKSPWIKCLSVSVPVAVALFLMFEVWFQVPLPKGPLESMFGY